MPDNDTRWSDVVDYVVGCTDSEVQLLYGLLRERQKTLRSIAAATAAATIKVGDKVRLRGISPKYLNGATGTVVPGGGAAKFLVQLDQAIGKFPAALPLTVPASCLEPA